MAVRKVWFQTLVKPSGAGSVIGGSTGASVSYSATTLGSPGVDNVNLTAPNIQITVPDDWGAATQSTESNDDSTVAYYPQIADAIEMNIIIMADGSIDKFYQLRDRFARTWAAGEFTIHIHTGDYHGGDQFVNGFISSFQFGEFRTGTNIKMTAQFTPTSPWYFQYGDVGTPENRAYGSCPTLAGTVSGDGGMVKASYVAAKYIKGIGSTGMQFTYANLGDPRDTQVDAVTADDFDEEPDHYDIADGIVYAYDASDILIGTYTVPDALLAFTMPTSATVQIFQYCEQYDFFTATGIGL